MKMGRITTDSSGYARHTFAEWERIPAAYTRRIALATVHQENEADGIYTVYITKITDEYIEFKTTRTEKASGLIGALVQWFIKPGSDHSCTVAWMLEADDNP